MTQLSISKKISFGFAAVLIVMLTGAVVAGLGILKVSERFSQLVDREFAAVRHMNRAKISLLEARRPEKDLLYADDPTLVAASNKFIDELIKEAEAAESLLKGSSEQLLAGDLATVGKLGKEYQAKFAAMAKAEVGQERMVAALAVRKSARELEERQNKVLDTLRTQIEAETVRSKRFAATTTSSALVIGIIALVIGGVLAFLIARAVRVPLEAMKTAIKSVQSSGDFSLRIGYRRQDEIGEAAMAFDSLMDELRSAIGDVQKASGAIGDAARAMSEAGSRVSQGSSAQAASATSVAAAMEETSVSISETASNVRRANEIAQQAQAGIGRSLAAMRDTVTNVEGVARLIRHTSANIGQLDESSKQIGGIVKVIKEIADQTNLLALNAAIEAARAGEQGRGFAVVADEVRKLAESTTKATNEIGDLIKGIQGQVEKAVSEMREATQETDRGMKLVEQTETALRSVGDDSANAADNVRAISDAVQEQDAAIHQVAASIEDIVKITDQNSAAADEAAQTSARLDQLAGQLRASVARFRT
jgi:methyl-accepting chemotaxis protein